MQDTLSFIFEHITEPHDVLDQNFEDTYFDSLLFKKLTINLSEDFLQKTMTTAIANLLVMSTIKNPTE